MDNHIDVTEISDEDIGVNMNRQAENLINNMATLDAMLELHSGDEHDRLMENISDRTINTMTSVVARKDDILAAVASKVELFANIIKEKGGN